MTILPAHLQHLLRLAQEAVERHPQHDLNLGYRQAIGKAFGPHRDSGLPGNETAHRRRARLCLLTMRHVLPVWEARFPQDNTPHRILDMAQEVLRGALAPDIATNAASRFWATLDDIQFDIGPEDAPLAALSVGYGVAKALVVACGEAWDDLDDDEVDYETTDSRDFTGNDTAFYAAIAWAGGPTWPVLARACRGPAGPLHPHDRRRRRDPGARHRRERLG